MNRRHSLNFGIERKTPAREHSLKLLDTPKLLDAWLLSCRAENKSPLTVSTYRHKISSFLSFISGYSKTIGNQEVRLYLVSLQEKHLSPSTISAHYRAIKTWTGWLMREGIIDGDPMPNVKPPRIPKTQPKPFSQKDLERIMLVTDGRRFTDYRDKALVLLMFDTLLRVSEVCRLTRDDLNIETGILKVMGKGSKERKVRIGLATRAALLRYMIRRNDDLPNLWLSENRQPLTLDGMKHAVHRLCTRAEITDAKRGPHTFRHTGAINFLRNGGGEFNLQQLLGHSTLTMTRHYVSAVSDDDVFKAHTTASPVDNFLKRQKSPRG